METKYIQDRVKYIFDASQQKIKFERQNKVRRVIEIISKPINKITDKKVFFRIKNRNINSYEIDNVIKNPNCSVAFACKLLVKNGIEERIFHGEYKTKEVLVDTIYHPYTGGNFHDAYTEEIYATVTEIVGFTEHALKRSLLNILKAKSPKYKKELLTKLSKKDSSLERKIRGYILE